MRIRYKDQYYEIRTPYQVYQNRQEANFKPYFDARENQEKVKRNFKAVLEGLV